MFYRLLSFAGERLRVPPIERHVARSAGGRPRWEAIRRRTLMSMAVSTYPGMLRRGCSASRSALATQRWSTCPPRTPRLHRAAVRRHGPAAAPDLGPAHGGNGFWRVRRLGGGWAAVGLSTATVRQPRGARSLISGGAAAGRKLCSSIHFSADRRTWGSGDERALEEPRRPAARWERRR